MTSTMTSMTSGKRAIINAVVMVNVAYRSGLTYLTHQGAASRIPAHPAMVRRRPLLRLASRTERPLHRQDLPRLGAGLPLSDRAAPVVRRPMHQSSVHASKLEQAQVVFNVIHYT